SIPGTLRAGCGRAGLARKSPGSMRRSWAGGWDLRRRDRRLRRSGARLAGAQRPEGRGVLMVADKGLLLGLFAFAAWGQTSEKVFYFAHLDTPQAIREVYNLVRSVGDIRDLSPDVAKRSLTVKGTADQIAAAAWLTAEMDKPGGGTGTRDFAFEDPKAPLMQVAYLKHVDNPQDLQGVVNAIRAM